MPAPPDSTETAAGSLAQFRTTHWSLILAAQDPQSPQCTVALEALCRIYWFPLYAYVRRLGHRPQDAEDLTQEFFARLLEKKYLQSVAPEKGRFRAFLLVAFKRFLANEWDRARAQKRGGGQTVWSLDAAEQRYEAEPAGGLPPDKMFERRWALTLLDQTLASLRAEFERAGKSGEYACLKECLTAERGGIDYAATAARLGATEGAARVAVHRLRRRFRELYRQQVAETVSAPEEIEDEIRYLRAALQD